MEDSMLKCKYFKDCNQNICPLDELIESRVGSRAEKCLDFPKVLKLLSDEQLKRYHRKVEKLK